MKNKKRTREVSAERRRRRYEPPKLVEEVVFERRALEGCAKEDLFDPVCSSGPTALS